MEQMPEIVDHQKRPHSLQIWQDSVFVDYYEDYYKELSSKQLDVDFNHQLRVLSKLFSRVHESEKQILIDLISKVIDFYVGQKVDKEIDYSFKKIFKF